MHDLLHVVTGYGRDPLGEACLTAFSYAQTKLKGFAVIAVFAARRIARARPGQPVWRAVFEGYRHGRSAGWLPGADWEVLLTQPVKAVRGQFAVKRRLVNTRSCSQQCTCRRRQGERCPVLIWLAAPIARGSPKPLSPRPER